MQRTFFLAGSVLGLIWGMQMSISLLPLPSDSTLVNILGKCWVKYAMFDFPRLPFPISCASSRESP